MLRVTGTDTHGVQFHDLGIILVDVAGGILRIIEITLHRRVAQRRFQQVSKAAERERTMGFSGLVVRLGKSGTISIVDPATAQEARLEPPCTPTPSNRWICVCMYNAMVVHFRRISGLRSYSVPSLATRITPRSGRQSAASIRRPTPPAMRWPVELWRRLLTTSSWSKRNRIRIRTAEGRVQGVTA